MTEISHSLTDGPLTTDGIDAPFTPPAPETPAIQESRIRKNAKIMGWVFFGVTCLLLFTLLKLPEDRIKNYVQGMIASVLAPKGVSFAVERGYVSVGWGISYVMKNITLNLPSADAPVHVDKVSFTPSLLPMVFGYRGGTLWIYNGDGSLNASFSMKGTQMSGSFKAHSMDLGKMGVLPIAAEVKGGAVITGKGNVAGDLSIPSTLTGDLDLTLNKIMFEQQTLMGFALPKLDVSVGKLEVNADKGKATVKTLNLGKPGNAADDIQATASGDIMLGRNWDSSTINGRANFKFSESVLKAFVLIDAILGGGKQGDGSYSFTITGPLTAPQTAPIGATK